MAQNPRDDQDAFLDGLVVGAVIGSVVGGLVASLVAPRLRRNAEIEAPHRSPEPPVSPGVDPGTLEDARRVLDEKIAELNQAIEQTRSRLWSSTQPSPPPEMPS
ncbi:MULTISPECIES: hypothetical protein [Gloeobacter]|uniref:Glr3539 protein n=2 Tax=Gloeobacter TaxID=33071 RepID=Q7NFI6_GLOVI|nr:MULTISPECIES: hypothetical protein [Gloeobacter]UFP96070.1 hypothetical protein ISF26_07630 [Gloeobacter morelensis MG652769]BAC91480.1 glr3539 [Gloeobacter violaceus PCC 7421]